MIVVSDWLHALVVSDNIFNHKQQHCYTRKEGYFQVRALGSVFNPSINLIHWQRPYLKIGGDQGLESGTVEGTDSPQSVSTSAAKAVISV